MVPAFLSEGCPAVIQSRFARKNIHLIPSPVSSIKSITLAVVQNDVFIHI